MRKLYPSSVCRKRCSGRKHRLRNERARATTAEAMRKALREVEPNLPVARVVPLSDLASDSLRQDRLIARLTLGLGVLALALACLGIYGLMSYAVSG